MNLIPKWLWPGRRQGECEKEARPDSSAGRAIQARFDAAETTDENYRHWASADGLSANAAASSEVRRTLRNRARYEVANNGYARGVVSTLGHHVVGTGPRLQMLLEAPEANRYIESRWSEWAVAVDLAKKLRNMRESRARDGEAFLMLVYNPELPTAVKLDLRLIEADQVADPFLPSDEPNAVDGIRFDEYGNPTEYHVLRHHPGDTYSSYLDEYISVPAESIIHYFREDRPGQRRGTPDITPALPLFAQLRRYTLAVLGAAETAAEFAAILYTDAPAGGESDDIAPLDRIPLERRMMTTAPAGWKLGQMHAEQPTTTYGEFKREILNEIGRCLNMPFNVVAGNSSGYNYASGRLDHQDWYKAVHDDQVDIENDVLRRIFSAWLAEAILVDAVLGLHGLRNLKYQWFWDGQEHVDPAKEASAQDKKLTNHATNYAIEYGKIGRDWEVEFRQIAKERKLMRELGITDSDVKEPLKENKEEHAGPQQAA